jgi:adenosylmethionine-8-amino-7-oxononanoate aminotransferase
MNLQEIDKKYHWHPYTQHQNVTNFPVIVKGKDALLWDENKKEYIDAIASWWVNPFGHSNTIIANAIYKQLTTLEHVLFGGFTHNVAIELAQKLMAILPKNQQKIFYSDNGSTAVEIAIKSSLQYNFNKGIQKTKIIAFEDAFHGDTFGAMAASGISFFTEAFQGSLLQVDRIPVPTEGNEQKSLQKLKELVATNEYAAFIFEPLVLGAAGMVMYKPEVLDELISICKNNNVFTIADEVMTGFGKTGKNFACDYLQQQPDMMCMSKALTGGTIPMAITTFTQDIFDGFLSDEKNKALFHGHTFTANPTGCAAAIASIDLLQDETIQANIEKINSLHKAFEEKIKLHPKVKTTRTLGVIFALEVVTETPEDYYGTLRNKLYDFFIDNGIILRPAGNIVYILPPYIITENQLQKVYNTIEKALEIV